MISSNALVLVVGLSVSQFAAAVSCIVVGEKTAKVQSSNGEKSPVFLASDCASLRIISGKAMVTWVSKDGKVSFAPIDASGPKQQPVMGSEERSGKVAWAELTTTRETRRPAFMRALGDEKAALVYIPESGILTKPKSGESLKIFSIDEGVETLVADVPEAQSFLITRDVVKPGPTYRLEWTKAGAVEKENWKLLGSAETIGVDVQYKEVQEVALDQDQRRLVTAMLFEQLKLATNMRMTLSGD